MSDTLKIVRELASHVLSEVASLCTCHGGYKSRNLTDPDCEYCSVDAGTLRKLAQQVIDGIEAGQVEQVPTLPEGWKLALHAAVSAIYFDDSSAYKSALGSVVRHIDAELAGELLCNPKAAYDKAVALLSAGPPAPAQPVKAWLVDGRIEQGLTFDKAAAETMAEMNCGTVRPLVLGDEGCTRSHPHELMSADCERKTVEAREANRQRCAELSEQAAPAPQQPNSSEALLTAARSKASDALDHALKYFKDNNLHHYDTDKICENFLVLKLTLTDLSAVNSAQPVAPALQCNYPLCQSESEQDRIAADVHQRLYDGDVRTDKTYAVGEIPWLYPHQRKPPRGVDLFLLQSGGMAIRGQWRDDGSFIAFQYFFKRDKEAEAEAGVLNGG